MKLRHHHYRGLATSVSRGALGSIFVTLTAAPALAAPHGGSGHLEAHRPGPHADNIVTLELAALEVIPGEANEHGASGHEMSMMGGHETIEHHLGVSVAFERTLVPGWLAAELHVLLAPGAHGLTLPVELLVKKPFELSPEVEAFVGLGLATEWIKAGVYEPQYGFASVLGSYFWVNPLFGLVLETDYSLLSSREIEHELVLAAGGAVRF